MTNVHLSKIQELLKCHLGDSVTQQGRVLFSSTATLKPGPVYFLGLNPGGKPDRINDELGFWPLQEDCQRIAEKPSGWSAYFDERWGGRGMFLQEQVQWLFKKLEYDLRQTPASNLIFKRSEDEDDLSEFVSLADQCWPVHEYLLDLIQPSLILAHGCGSVYRYLQSKAPDAASGEEFSAGHGTWKCRHFCWNRNGRPILVFAVPHLSRYKVKGKSAVTEKITSLHKSVKNLGSH